MKIIKLLSTILVLTSFVTAQANPVEIDNDIKTFKQELITKFKFKQDEVNKVISHANYNDKIVKTMDKPYEDHSYDDYRKIFLTKKRIAEGKDFLESNKEFLASVSKKYGIAPEIIVAIIGIESNYGKNKTQFSTLDSLYTLAFYYPKRSKYFRYELAQFLILCRELNISPESVQGSYAGALGIPQFMPSSYRHYARTSFKHHKPNLFDNKEDAMTSIGNYLHHFGWAKGEPTVVNIKTKDNFSNVDPQKKYTLKQLSKEGITTSAKLKPSERFRLIQVDQETSTPRTWLGLRNFDVIKKYNKSDLYVLAVTELAEQISRH
jgi:membrane-bound lytic murein transglycosylase B